MSENVFKKKEKKKSTRKPGAFSKTIHQLMDGSFLTMDRAVNLVPFFFFLAFIAILFIANTYYAEKKIKTIDNMRKEIVELRTQFITTRSELMFLTNQSEVARMLSSSGIKESRIPPVKVEDEKGNKNFLLRLFKN